MRRWQWLAPALLAIAFMPAAGAAGAPLFGVTVDRIPHLDEVVSSLAALPERAAVRVGEIGLPRRVSKRTRPEAEQIMRWAYSLDPGLPYYAGGYFWWYGSEDALSARAPLRVQLGAAFESEASVLQAR